MHRWFFLALAGFTVGCGGQRFTDVDGIVTFDGKPLPAGLILFTNADDTLAASAYLRGDGTYSARNVPAGPVKVAIRTDEFKGAMTEKQAADLRARGLPAPTFDAKVKGFKYVPIPERFADRETSGLTFEVVAGGPNRIEIALGR